QGYYTFASVPVGTYDLTVEMAGFQSVKVTGIPLGGGEKRNVNASLQVGNTTQTVEVTGSADIITPVDSGAKAAVLTTQQLQNFVQVGSNAAEYLKIIPGFGNFNGNNNKSNYTGQVIGINANGDGGSQSPLNNAFSYNGLPGNTLDIVADGAHVSDPGCNCDTPVNPNSDFLQEMRVQTSNFSAEEQKGPMVITSVTKAGGSQFHGVGFFSARNYTLNSNDAYANATGVARPADKFYYPGGAIGGPVLIPGTKFNHNHDKLFFFTGYEYFFQTIDTGVLTATVPTKGMRTGNFCASEVAGEGTLYNGKPANAVTFPGGGCQMPTSLLDPNMQALMNLFPLPNASGFGFNYAQSEIFNQNNQQWVARVDYNVSDNTKIFVRYNLQRETQPFPVGLWWRNGGQVPYPTPVEGKNRSDSVTGTLTHVFSPTMTNETVFAYTFVGFPNVFADPAKVNPKNVGFNENLLFQNKATSSQIPAFGAFGPNEAALIFNPGGFEAGGVSSGLYANKYMPSVSDTLTKVIGTHTAKAGFFYEWIRNAQPANNYTNGLMQFVPSSNQNFTTGNAYADMLEGNMSQFQQQNFNRVNDISYNTWEGFIQDSWKITPKLTLEGGLRITHFDPWIDRLGYGYSIFIPSQYNAANQGACSAAPTFCGFQWHSRDSAVPLGGFPSRGVFWQPRFGVAYDLFGTGRTVFRGGWGRFYYHSGQFTSGLDTAAGSASITLTPSSIGNNPLYVRNLASMNVTALPSTPSAVDSKDNKQPYTDSYSFTISQKTPWRGLLEVGYVGNQSNDLQNTSGYGSNINLVPVGAMFKTDPITGKPGTDPFNANANDYRPYYGYGDINQATNNLYSNYNALQLTWAHQDNRTTIQLNYTLGRSLGIVPGPGGGSNLSSLNAATDPFNLRNNYGPLPGDRRHLFNAAYSVMLPSPIHDNKILSGVVNGWQLSGITQFESGGNITANSTNGNYNLQLNSAVFPGTTEKISNQSLLGTNAIQLNPIITCNPTANLGAHQWINGSCFGVPTQGGQNGPTILPAIYGPAFFNTDLGLFKNFQIKESMKLQFRIQANNFLNHPLWSLSQGNALNLNFTQDTTGKITQSNSQFGTAQYKTGQRIVLLEVKFYF
ncbi:MAG: carboxypeptidase regulatory-like domain-containing protein, partial [Acidobacteriaceae bacterium]|nr:carboxypeptidase regulatory-like domain-containing protein [Acidobacteriaceae bacterium]